MKAIAQILVYGAAPLLAVAAAAADTNAPAEAAPAVPTQEEFFEGEATPAKNWIELSTGGFITSGSKAQQQQQLQNSSGPFGGISDFHFQRDLKNATSLTADGRALFDEHDYRLRLAVTREKVGFVRLTYDEFRTWYNGAGGYFPPLNLWYPLSDNSLALDRGEFSLTAGLRVPDQPNLTFRYSHGFRDGQKSSTIWGFTHPAGGPGVRGLSPSFYDINERRDAFELDATHRIGKTDLGLGFRYELGTLEDTRKITQFPNEFAGGQSIQQKITDRQSTVYDLFNLHAFTETWFKPNLMFSSGFSYSSLKNDLSGSRVGGSDFDIIFLPDPQNDFGYFNLEGQSRLREYVLNLNLLFTPLPNLTIVPSLRARRQSTETDITAIETLGDNPASRIGAHSDGTELDVRERLDVTYSGITNWIFNARGEWTQGQGDIDELGGLGPISGFGVPPVQRQTDDNRFLQKYSLNARWYPDRRVIANVGGYYKIHQYDYTHHNDSTPNFGVNRYPAYLTMHEFETWDGNAGLTLRPWRNVNLGTRYEYQLSTVRTQPDPVSGLREMESAEMTSHVFAQNIGWIPWSRLNLQLGFNYVVSEATTPVIDFTRAVLTAQNNYWTLNAASTLVLDDKTDLHVGYFFYQAADYRDNAAFGVPYGAGAEEHAATAELVRRLNANLRVTLKYGFFHYTDEASGGFNNFDAHLLMTSLQYRF